MPRSGRSKLSRRRPPTPRLRQFSPELPLLYPPSPAPEPEPWMLPELEPGPRQEPKPGPGQASDPKCEPEQELKRKPNSGQEPERKTEPKPEPKPKPESERKQEPAEPSSDSDDDIFLTPHSSGALEIDKGDIVLCKHQGFQHPALVTRLPDKKRVTVKFIYDLVTFKEGHPFKRDRKSCLPFSYEEKVRCRELAQTADPHTAKILRLALEAVEELETSRAMKPVENAEEFLKTQCDYILRLHGSPGSVPGGAAAPAPGSPAVAEPPSPLRPPPRLDAAAGYDDAAEIVDSDSDDEPTPLPTPPPSLPQPPPPLPPHLREEQIAYAHRLLEVVLSDRCGRHLRTIHSGKTPSWRREAFRSGARRRLLTSCSLGDLETCPDLAERARKEALRVTGQLKQRRPANLRLYAEEVLAPEAVLFAVAELSEAPRAEKELEEELAGGAPRFRT